MSTPGVAPSSTPSSISRRRNGLQPACEPCRKSKIRCDYSTSETSCSRCRKRQILPQCIVLDSPMTNNGITTTRFIAHKPRTSRNKFPITPSPSIATPRVDVAPVVHEERVPDSTGFFGSTSFHDTLRQAAHGLREIQGEFDDDPQCLPMKLDLAVKLLQRVPSQALCEKLINHYKPNSAEGLFPKAIVREFNATFWATYGEELRSGEVETMGAEIRKCTKVSLKQCGSPQEWREQFCGANTRFEVLGLLFTSFTFGIAALEENDLMFSDPDEPEWTRKKALNGMKACVEMCIELCGNSLNILTTILLYKNLLLETIIHGDASITVWRLHHDLVAMGTALGLHCYQGRPEVTIHSELTKRLSSALFWGDKEIALFTGRPPALTRLYHTCPLPLDVSDEALLTGGDTLQEEIDNLDGNGWNTEKKFHSATLIRKLLLISFVQDEVMELFVANKPELQFFKERVDALKRKTTEIYKQMPIIIDAKKEMLSACKDDNVVWNLLFNRLDFLRVHLNLERLASERGHDSKEKLYQIARELVDLAVFFWVERDRSRDRHYDYDFMIMCYGMPSTGILCTALLKQTQYPSEVPDSIKLPTSEVVQNLSLMVGFLEWIRPFAGSYKLCQRMAKVIRRVLDQVFDPTPEGQVSSQESQEEGGQGPWQLEDPWQVDLSSEWNWLNSIDWNRGANWDFGM